jgi:hypothetical protein
MQGIFLKGERPKSKKQVREAIAYGGVEFVSLEATSFFGNEYDGPVTYAPEGKYVFVGPDPHTKRNFYGTLTVAITDGERVYKVV